MDRQTRQLSDDMCIHRTTSFHHAMDLTFDSGVALALFERGAKISLAGLY